MAAGLIVNVIKRSKNNNDYLEFNYRTEDSLFNAALSNTQLKDSLQEFSGNKTNSRFSLNTNGNIIHGIKKKVIPASKTININSAPIGELTLLPGIGEKTAKSIIEYRMKHNKFKSVDEILNVNGIGDKKLNKIKKFICIE